MACKEELHAMEQESVLMGFIEEGWHFQCNVTLKDSVTGVQVPAKSCEIRKGSNHVLLSNSKSESEKLSPPSTTNSSVTSSYRPVDGTQVHQDENMIRTNSELKRVFETYDENGDGQICVKELGNFMKKLGVQVSEEELTCMMKSVDSNGDGYVDFEEFLELHTSLVAGDDSLKADGHVDEDDELLEAFQVFDKDEDGFISVTELQSVLRNLGINAGVKLQDCQRMISAVDKNNDGQVDFAEFKKLMASFPSTT